MTELIHIAHYRNWNPSSTASPHGSILSNLHSPASAICSPFPSFVTTTTPAHGATVIHSSCTCQSAFNWKNYTAPLPISFWKNTPTAHTTSAAIALFSKTKTEKTNARPTAPISKSIRNAKQYSKTSYKNQTNNHNDTHFQNLWMH